MSDTHTEKKLAGGRVAFLGSFPQIELLPGLDLPEIAFAGRSNVGKSSAINRLLGTKKAARVSSTPGRTQAINLFRVEERLVFADLPGYGFAKVPEAMKHAWKALVEGYLGGRRQLRLVVVLVDSRHSVQSLDAELLWGLRQARLPVLVLATKADKLSRNKRASQIAGLRRELRLKSDEILPFSSTEGFGVPETWARLNAAALSPQLPPPEAPTHEARW